MNVRAFQSEIRDSEIRELLEKAKKQNYANYLLSMRLDRIRLFKGAKVNFDFPVTALIGPNGGGKSTILGAAACIYESIKPKNIFRKSLFGDEEMDDWKIEYDIVDKEINPKGVIRADLLFAQNAWSRTYTLDRNVLFLGIYRTVPPLENPLFSHRKKLSVGEKDKGKLKLTAKPVDDINSIKSNAEKILGKSLANFQLLEITFTTTKTTVQSSELLNREIKIDGDVTTTIVSRKKVEPIQRITINESKKYIFIGDNTGAKYSEFNFGAGEASVIHMVADIESQNNGSLVLIEEIENGLHPLAVHRMVEYLIEVAKRKNIQTIFTTHSDYALSPLPPEAIWASVDGKVQQGKLTVETLRAISGRIDKRLAIFVEDNFAKLWVEAIVRERLSENFEEIGIYPVFGDGNAVTTHLSHTINPAVAFHSLCFIDGDSRQAHNTDTRIFRLPGDTPEATIFNSVLKNLEKNIALLTVACQRPIDKQSAVIEAAQSVSHTNRDPHLLFSQVGIKLNFTSEEIIRGAFLNIWIQENSDEVDKIAEAIKLTLALDSKIG